MSPSEIHIHEGPPREPSLLRWIGWSFMALGAVSILAPQLATVVASTFVAAAMVVWGGLGLWMSLALRPFPETWFAAVTFGLLGVLGLAFIALPTLGTEVLTMLLVAGFLAEGVLSIVYGLRVSERLRGWGSMVASGVASLVVGLVALFGWPDTATWLLGLLLGLDFLSTGFALLALGRTSPRAAR